MSRSYRKPYSAITGTNSAKQDKIFAHRAERRAQNLAIKLCLDWDEFLIPDKLECSYNDPWGWGRDGKQSLHFPPNPNEFKHDEEFNIWWYEYQVKYYASLCRK